MKNFYIRRDRWIQAMLTDPTTRTPAAARDVGVLVATMMTSEHPFAFPSEAWLAKKTGHSIRSVERAVAKLKKSGYLKIHDGGIDLRTGKTFSNRYELAFSKQAGEKFLAEFRHFGEISRNFPKFPTNFPAPKNLQVIENIENSNRVAPSPLAGSPVTTGGLMSDSGRATSRRSTGVPRRSRHAPVPALDFPEHFLRFWALAEQHDRIGRTKIENAYRQYQMALSYEGVTFTLLYARYAKHLTESKKGDYIMRFLRSPRRYATTGFAGDKTVAIEKNPAKTHPTDSSEPEATTTATATPATAPAPRQTLAEKQRRFLEIVEMERGGAPLSPKELHTLATTARDLKLIGNDAVTAIMVELGVTKFSEIGWAMRREAHDKVYAALDRARDASVTAPV